MGHLFAGRRWVIETTLTKEECVSRMKSKVRVMWDTKWDPERPLYGTVSSSGFAVQITTSLRRGYNPFFIRGKFTPGAAGTTIRAKYGVLTTYRLFVTGMASFFLFMGWRVVSLGLPPDLAPFLGGMTALMVLLIYWRVGGLIRLAEFDRDLILDAVAEILDARISDAPEAAA